jgi:hypothetical protein
MIQRCRYLFSALLAVWLVGCGAAPAQQAPQESVAPAFLTSLAHTPEPAAPPTSEPVASPTSEPATEVATTPQAPTEVPASPTLAASTATQAAQATQPATNSGLGGELLFLRDGQLMASDLASKSERLIAEGVRDFSSNADGSLIAFVTGSGLGSELWLVNRDGSNLKQLTNNQRTEAQPVLSPDGQFLAFSASSQDLQIARGWSEWSRWCTNSEVILLELASQDELTLGAGCDPAVAPDSKRIAFASAPLEQDNASNDAFILAKNNTIHLVNRQGQNGWDFAKAGLSSDGSDGLLVFGPAWSSDGAYLAYHRFIGYQALTDIIYTEVGKSFEGKGAKIALGAGWMAPMRFAPQSTQLAISQDNVSDARGWGGYEQWKAVAVSLSGSHNSLLPQGEITLASSLLGELDNGQQMAWSPNGNSIAVQLPSDWEPLIDMPNEGRYTSEAQGALWLWLPGQHPQEKLVETVDFGSPILWLP